MASADRDSQKLIERHQDLVRSIASGIGRKVPQYIDVEDLIGYGQIGLAQAARDFDPKRGAVFSTYAYYRIRGAIYDGLSKLCWTSRARYNRLRHGAGRTDGSSVDGASSDVGSVRDGLGDNVDADGNKSRGLAVVFFAAMSQGGSEDGAALLEDLSTPSPLERVANDELVQKVQKLLETLPRQAADLIHARYFDGLTLQEAGKQLGISKSWACRLHAKTLQQLDQSLKMEEITK